MTTTAGSTARSTSRAGVVAEIAERRLADIGRELGAATYRDLADAAADSSAAPENAPPAS